MLNFNDKPLEQLSLEETIEFEKQLLKKVVGAGRAEMSQGIIDQLMNFVQIVRAHKQEKIAEVRENSIKKKPKEAVEDQDEGLNIGEIEQTSPDDTE
jgi:uncharacterized protein YjgD (DUF1641 family)